MARSVFRKVERSAYLADRAALDVRAALRGPVPLAKRVVRRKITRSLFGGARRRGLW